MSAYLCGGRASGPATAPAPPVRTVAAAGPAAVRRDVLLLVEGHVIDNKHVRTRVGPDQSLCGQLYVNRGEDAIVDQGLTDLGAILVCIGLERGKVRGLLVVVAHLLRHEHRRRQRNCDRGDESLRHTPVLSAIAPRLRVGNAEEQGSSRVENSPSGPAATPALAMRRRGPHAMPEAPPLSRRSVLLGAPISGAIGRRAREFPADEVLSRSRHAPCSIPRRLRCR